VPATELVLRRLLPLAHDGLARFGVDAEVRDRLLGVIEGRCITGRNGAYWQIESVAAMQRTGASRADALRRMALRYADHMHANEPVHTWPVDA
jgi:hypothetical protein